MPFKKGAPAHNKREIPTDVLVARYQEKSGAVRELAKEFGVSIVTIYNRLHALGVSRRRGGEANKGTQAGENNPNWKGGRHLDIVGYVVVRRPDGKQVREHRLVMELLLGRPLESREVVHHRNHNRADNRPFNLELMPSHSQHMKEHMTPDEARRRGKLGLESRHKRA